MDKIKLEIAGLSYSQTQSGAYALVLSESIGKRRLPIIIGGFEAQAIAIELEKMTPSRPLTHDLFKNFAELFKTPIRHNAIKQLLLDNRNPWWDDVTTKNYTESLDDFLGKAGSLSLIFLKNKLGKNQNQWNWGKLHSLELIHPLGRMKPLNHLFNIGPEPVNGAYMIVNAQSARNSWDSFKVASGPSTRRIIDFSTPLDSWGILPSGNSGHLADPFYDNQWQDYLNLRLQERKLSYSQIVNAHSFLQLKPSK